MLRIGSLIIGTALLSACATAPLDTQRSELNEARTLIAKAKAAGAEECPSSAELQATAVAKLYMAAHEYSEGDAHPDEQASLAAGSIKAAQEAYDVAKRDCGKAAPKAVAPKPVAQEVIALEGVYFESNSEKLTDASVATLNAATATLKKRESIRVEVAAYTDSRGKESYNQSLSERRAKSVMNYLVERGIDAARLSAKGYGELSPIADNATAEGRAKNRRVELRVQ